MKQAWHIFAKDVRHFWPEIAATVTIAALFAWIGQFEWISATTFGVGGNARALQGVAGLLTGLLPVSWWILITRVVQGEKVGSLVTA